MSHDITSAPLTVVSIYPKADGRQGLAAKRQELAAEQPSRASEPPGLEREQLQQAIEELYRRVHSLRRTNIDFSIDETSGKTVIKVIDTDRREVILQLPPEHLLALARFFAGDDFGKPNTAAKQGLIRGLLIDAEA